MILRFRFSNYRSFRDEVELSALATRLDGDAAVEVRVSPETGESVKALPLIAVLGANASGKSNLIRAVEFMRSQVMWSAFSAGSLGLAQRDPFRLGQGAEQSPSLFEVDFALGGNRYLYGFELDETGVAAEWLHTFPHRRAQLLFDREGNEFTFGRNLPGANKRIADLTRRNALFLSTAANANHGFLTRIFSWFSEGVTPVKLGEPITEASLARKISGRERQVSEMLRLADLGIVGARVHRQPADKEQQERFRKMIARDIPSEAPDRDHQIEILLDGLASDDHTIRLAHRGPQGTVELPFEEESLGTRAWLKMVVIMLDALRNGGTVLADELDASLHPGLMAEILRLFRNQKTNRRSAQLIFTTHDTWTLGTKGDASLSRGQIWFVEKDPRGFSALTPLSEYRPRKGEDLEKGYLMGRYGGVPRPQSNGIMEVIADKGDGLDRE